jgi:hypothetical protein
MFKNFLTFIFVLFCFFFQFSLICAQEEINFSESNEKEMEKIVKAIKNNQSLKCNLLDLKNNEIKTILIKGDKIKLIDEKTKVSFIKNKKYYYIWNSNNKIGLEINHSNKELDLLKEEKLLSNSKLTCRNYQITEKAFALPLNIEFLKYEKMFTQINK